jgi:hypothetical protein
MIRTLLALMIGAGALAMASVTPAAAENSSPLKCLVLDSVVASVAYDVCTCKVAKVDNQTLRLLRPNAIRVAALCPLIANGGGGGISPEVASEEPTPHGHGFSFSKASSTSTFVGTASGGLFPSATAVAGEHTTSIAAGDGGSSAVAGSGGNSAGGSYVSGSSSGTVSGTSGSTWGGTGGSSCAGNCGGGGGAIP